MVWNWSRLAAAAGLDLPTLVCSFYGEGGWVVGMVDCMVVGGNVEILHLRYMLMMMMMMMMLMMMI